MTAHKRTIEALVAFSCIAWVNAGCGGTEFTPITELPGADASPAPDASVDVSTVEDTGQPPDADASGPPLCIVPPVALGTESSFCGLEARLASRCGQCEACRQTNLNNCVAMGDALSAAFKSILLECEAEMACGDFKTYGSDPCVAPKLDSLVPGAAQAAAKNAYCTACPNNPAECASFFTVPTDAGTDGGVHGAGRFVLIAGDAIASDITKACSGGLNCNPYLYYLCTVGTFCGKTGPDACNTGFCGK